MACFNAISGTEAAAGEVVRVVSWNLKWFPGGRPEALAEEREKQMAAAQNVLKQLNPDILLLQEVANDEAAKELLSVLPDFTVHVVSAFTERPQNVVVASRFPAIGAWFEQWKKRGYHDPPRGFSFAALQAPGGRLLLVYCLHLKSNVGNVTSNVTKREESSVQLLDHLQQMIADYGNFENLGILVGGDFNTSIDDERFSEEKTIRCLRQAGLFWTFEGVLPGERVTIPASEGYPDNCFDHILTSGLGRAQSKVVQVPWVSDHNPVILDFDAGINDVIRLRAEGAKPPGR
ncbi:MAG TPA: endonuclease/exonuclease/phosphatase family protein [Terrimicrobiaceae bacterium]